VADIIEAKVRRRGVHGVPEAVYLQGTVVDTCSRIPTRA
jgi:hypothetical protein